MSDKFTVSDFIKALGTGRFQRTIELQGMVKQGVDANTLMFSISTDCTQWATIPVNLIEGEVLVIDTVPCRDHSHPLVRISLKFPDEQDQVALAFADLLSQFMRLMSTRRIDQREPDPRGPHVTCGYRFHCRDGRQFIASSGAWYGDCDECWQSARNEGYRRCNDDVLNYERAHGCS